MLVILIYCFVAVPAGVRQVLPSLLAFDPTVYGLPAFHDVVEGVIPMEPVLMLKGTVVKGFGRGSKVWMQYVCPSQLAAL